MTEARTFRLTVAYDGTDFHGWQRQPELRTVQGELERALNEVLGDDAGPLETGGGPVTLNGAGRTDAGVHARGQVASFRARTVFPGFAIGPMAQKRLPRDVRVVRSEEASPGFHARHSARARRYEYRLLDAHDPMYGRFAWFPARRYEGDGLERSATALVGTHDCTSIGAKGSSPVSPICRIDHAVWRRWERGWLFDVQADHFLYHMVRNLVGTALWVSRDADPAGRMAEILASRRRSDAGPTVSPRGLSLEGVTYEGEES